MDIPALDSISKHKAETNAPTPTLVLMRSPLNATHRLKLPAFSMCADPPHVDMPVPDFRSERKAETTKQTTTLTLLP